MTWNHRVIRTVEDHGECFYEKNGDVIPTDWTAEPVGVSAETRDGLFWVLSSMTEAVGQPAALFLLDLAADGRSKPTQREVSAKGR